MTAAPSKAAARCAASIRSILSLAGSIAAVPLVDSAAEAEIIVSSSINNVRVGTGGVSSRTLDLPGTADIVFAKLSRPNPTYGNTMQGTVKATITNGLIGRQADTRSQRWQPGSNVAFRTNANVAITWNANAGNRTNAAAFADITRGQTSQFYGPDGQFSNKFLLFNFTNSLAANQTNYGWVEMKAGNISGNYDSNSVTFGRWAYQNDGRQIGAGQTVAAPVPEPTTAGMAMAGALVAGVAGLRRYRKQQAAAKAAAAA